MDILHSIILGAVEGFTEFLPVSSTGHLILVSELLGIPQSDFHKTFEVVIQLGSILSILFVFKDKIFIKDRVRFFNIWSRLAIAFIPTGILGFLLYKHIKELFSSSTVATMLIVGGVIFILLELFHKEKNEEQEIESISYKKAFLVGCFQSLAMIPGTSRSGATIMGGLFLGFSRKLATEFSFMLALPTMVIATIYDVYKNFHTFDFSNGVILAVGFVTAFLFALVAIKSFLAFVSKFNFIPFGIYRIIVGVLFYIYIL